LTRNQTGKMKNIRKGYEISKIDIAVPLKTGDNKALHFQEDY
jgi:hypothetical protein